MWDINKEKDLSLVCNTCGPDGDDTSSCGGSITH